MMSRLAATNSALSEMARTKIEGAGKDAVVGSLMELLREVVETGTESSLMRISNRINSAPLDGRGVVHELDDRAFDLADKVESGLVSKSEYREAFKVARFSDAYVTLMQASGIVDVEEAIYEMLHSGCVSENGIISCLSGLGRGDGTHQRFRQERDT